MGYTLICTLTTHLYLTNPYLVLLQCYNASHIIIVIFCCLSIKAHFTVTHFFLYVVFLAVNLWWYHTVMTLLFTSSFLLLWLSNSGNSKARWEQCPSYNICLIGRNKKAVTSLAKLHVQCTDTWRALVFAIMPKIAVQNSSWKPNGKIHFGFSRLEYSSGSPLEVVHLCPSDQSDQNYFAIPFLTNWFITVLIKQMVVVWLLLVGPIWKMLFHFFLWYSHWSCTGWFGIMEHLARNK